jgi:hypothetical protein
MIWFSRSLTIKPEGRRWKGKIEEKNSSTNAIYDGKGPFK